MSFFKNLRSSMTRSKSSSRDSTPVRHSRPASVISHTTSRRDSVESRPDSIFNRSDTFIKNGSDAEQKNHSNSSTLEKKSKKSKVLSKFNTFTKRKKSTSPADHSPVLNEHHPKDNATNTYYQWKTEPLTPSVGLNYNPNADPFNCLYEQQSSLKNYQNKEPSAAFDSSTYRKGKMPQQLKDQLVLLKKTQGKGTDLPLVEDELEEHNQDESEKYKTVTLDSFRKSFRDKFMQPEKQENYNPSWFVKVEAPATKPVDSNRSRKENRNDILIFENDNYRPESRSPVRDRPSRSNTRSPVKRNETFKVDRASKSRSPAKHAGNSSIHIEFKNSINPHVPGRMVPVGVAKPMPSRGKHEKHTPSYLSQYIPVDENWHNPQENLDSRRNSVSPSFNSSNKPTSTYLKQYAPVYDNFNKSQDNLNKRRNSGSSGSRALTPSYLKEYVSVDENWHNPEEHSGSRRNSVSPSFNSTNWNKSQDNLNKRRNSGSSGLSYLKEYLPVNENWHNPHADNLGSRRNSISPTFNASQNSAASYMTPLKTLNADWNKTMHQQNAPRHENWNKLAFNAPKITKSSTVSGRYQTRVHIGNDHPAKPLSKTTGPTRIQLKADGPSRPANYLPTKNASPSTRHTYFGDSPLHAASSRPSSILANKSSTNTSMNNSKYYNAPSTAVSYLNRNSQKQQIQPHKVIIPMQRRSRSPIKMPWR